MRKLLTKIVGLVYCKHDWEFVRKIREQNLRGGYTHESHIHVCTKCGKTSTVEIPNSGRHMR